MDFDTAPAALTPEPPLTLDRLREQIEAIKQPILKSLRMAPDAYDLIRSAAVTEPLSALPRRYLALGIPVHVDRRLPDGVIELRNADGSTEVIVLIQKATSPPE